MQTRDMFAPPPPHRTKPTDREWYMGEIFRLRCEKCGSIPKVVLSYATNYWDNEITLTCCGKMKTLRIFGRTDGTRIAPKKK